MPFERVSVKAEAGDDVCPVRADLSTTSLHVYSCWSSRCVIKKLHEDKFIKYVLRAWQREDMVLITTSRVLIA